MWWVVIVGAVGGLVALSIIPVRFRLTWQTAVQPHVMLSLAWPMESFRIRIPFGTTATPAGIRQRPQRRQSGAPTVKPTRPPASWTAVLSTISPHYVRLILHAGWIVFVEGARAVRRAFRLRRVIIDGEYGGANPAVTGQVYGWAHALAGSTGNRLIVRLTPNFLEPRFAGSCDLIGSLVLYPLLWFPAHLILALARRLTVGSMRDLIRELLSVRRAMRRSGAGDMSARRAG